MNDLISRQAAIDALDNIGSLDTDADREYARSIFNAVPSAQQDILSYLTDRPCAVCKCHTEDGCSKWECVFEGRING